MITSGCKNILIVEDSQILALGGSGYFSGLIGNVDFYFDQDIISPEGNGMMFENIV